MARRDAGGPAPCPVCEEPLESGFCRGCGYDAAVAVSPEDDVGGLDLPEGDEFDYEGFLEGEGLGGRRRGLRGRRLFLLLAALIALAAFVGAVVLR